jgi:hypothetical protein
MGDEVKVLACPCGKIHIANGKQELLILTSCLHKGGMINYVRE